MNFWSKTDDNLRQGSILENPSLGEGGGREKGENVKEQGKKGKEKGRKGKEKE
jgi:hypothetical protein